MQSDVCLICILLNLLRPTSQARILERSHSTRTRWSVERTYATIHLIIPRRLSESGPKMETSVSTCRQTQTSLSLLRRYAQLPDLTKFCTLTLLLQQVLETATDADPNSLTLSDQPRGNETPASTLTGRTLEQLGIQYANAC